MASLVESQIKTLPDIVCGSTVIRRFQTMKYYSPRFGYNLGCSFCQYYDARKGQTLPNGSAICAVCHSFCYLKCKIETQQQIPIFDLQSSHGSDQSTSSDGFGAIEPFAPSVTRVIRCSREFPRPSKKIKVYVTPALVQPTVIFPGFSHTLSEVSSIESLFEEQALVRLFEKFDVLALCEAYNVCTRWRNIVEKFYKKKLESSLLAWGNIVHTKARNFQELVYLNNTLYSTINCERCFQLKIPPPYQRSDKTFVNNNMIEFDMNGVSAKPVDTEGFKWVGRIKGPSGTAYEGGTFYLHIFLHEDCPIQKPVVKFITKIFHPNISKHGEIQYVKSADNVEDNSTPDKQIRSALISIRKILADPLVGFPMHRHSNLLFKKHPEEFIRIAREWTEKYGNFKPKDDYGDFKKLYGSKRD